MSVALRFINVIIPIENIERCKSVGGFDGIKEMQKDYIGGKVYFDDFLYRDSAMNPIDAEGIVKFWEKAGLELFETINGEKHWKDLCVVEDLFGGPTLPCDWLEMNQENGFVCAHLKGKPQCSIVGAV